MLPVISEGLDLPAPGQVVVWGNNDHRQVSGRPRGHGFTRIAPGGATQGLALGSDGIPVLWGGHLPPQTPIVPPLNLPTGETYIEIALGASFAAGIRASDGGIDTWGGGFAATPFTKADLPPMSPTVKFIALTVGGGHGVAITEDRTLVQWGGTASGTPPNPEGRTFFEVRARSSYSIARDDIGQLYGWGSGLFAPPGPKVLLDPPWEFIDADGGYWLHPGPFSAIAAGVRHVLALNADDDSVSGWGSDGDGESSGAPTGVKFSAVAAGRNFSIGLDRDAKLHHWGYRLQVTTVSSGTPRRGLLEAVPEGHFSAISAATMHATALRRDLRVDPDTIVDRVIPDRPYRF